MNSENRTDAGRIRCSYGKSTVGFDKLNISHCHDKYEILYVMEGSGKILIEGRDYPMSANTLIVIPPLEYHCVELDPGAVYERRVIYFGKTDLLPEAQALLSGFGRNEDDSLNYYVSALSSPLITSHFEQLDSIDSVPEKLRSEYARMVMSTLILLLSATSGEQISYTDEELGARVIRYLGDHIDKDVSLDKLAKRFFVSKFYLCRAFKKHNGISIHGYINRKRVMHAKQLIEAGETATSAAYKVGFGDYSAFYRAYVKIVGKSPTA